MKYQKYTSLTPEIQREIDLFSIGFTRELMKIILDNSLNENIDLSSALGGYADPSKLGPRIEAVLTNFADTIRSAGNTEIGRIVGSTWLDTIKVDINNAILNILGFTGLKSSDPGGQVISQALADINGEEWGRIADDWTGYGCNRVSDAIVKGIAMPLAAGASGNFQAAMEKVPIVGRLASLFPGGDSRLSRMARQYGVDSVMDSESIAPIKSELSNFLCNDVASRISNMKLEDAKEEIIALVTGLATGNITQDVADRLNDLPQSARDSISNLKSRVESGIESIQSSGENQEQFSEEEILDIFGAGDEGDSSKFFSEDTVDQVRTLLSPSQIQDLTRIIGEVNWEDVPSQ